MAKELENPVFDIQSQSLKTARQKLKLTMSLGALAMTPVNWTKPLVKSIVLPAHAQTSISTLISTATCAVTGPSTIFITAGVTTAGPFNYTITNTGTSPIIGGDILVIADSDAGTTGGLTSSVGSSVPDPLLPGEVGGIVVLNLSANSCPIAGGNGTITVGLQSAESMCTFVINVTCVV